MSEARWWRAISSEQALCELCPRACLLREGQVGFCGVRRMEDGGLKTLAWGATSGLCADPIEKKPLYHFLPGSRVLSFGMLGCTLGCSFCQNASLSRGRDLHLLRPTRPEDIARLAEAEDCLSVAFTYNEPIVSAEWCLEVAAACREAGLRTVAVTSGYVSGVARKDFFTGMDAANVDLKAFSDSFYRRYCAGKLQPVLETLEELAQEGRVWLEVTTLLIPGENDGEAELHALSDWLLTHLGPDVPLHFTAFHPAHHLRDHPRTSLRSLRRAREIARSRGIRFIYTGNVQDEEGSTTFCPKCGEALITRDGFTLTRMSLRGDRCPICGVLIPGHFPQAGAPGATNPAESAR